MARTPAPLVLENRKDCAFQPLLMRCATRNCGSLAGISERRHSGQAGLLLLQLRLCTRKANSEEVAKTLAGGSCAGSRS